MPTTTATSVRVHRLWAALSVLVLFVGFATIAFTSTAGAVPVRTYPNHTSVASTTFWVGEIFNVNAADGSQVCSTYNDKWAFRWSGVSNGSVAGNGTDCAGAPLGGCDGRPSGSGVNFRCVTERRTAANGYFPTSAAVHPRENPFYLDLPFDDLNNSAAFRARGAVVPWANDPGYAGYATDGNYSFMKNRWVAISKSGATCYAQVEDAGPGQYNDQAYVFGSNDSRPANRQFNGAGMDVSPAVNGCLSYSELDGDSDVVSWRFVENTDVPAGPWANVVTTSQVNDATPSAAYIASIKPPSGVPGSSSTTAPSSTTTVTATTPTTTAPTTATTTTTTTESTQQCRPGHHHRCLY
jgi:hypothetical protein